MSVRNRFDPLLVCVTLVCTYNAFRQVIFNLRISGEQVIMFRVVCNTHGSSTHSVHWYILSAVIHMVVAHTRYNGTYILSAVIHMMVAHTRYTDVVTWTVWYDQSLQRGLELGGQLTAKQRLRSRGTRPPSKPDAVYEYNIATHGYSQANTWRPILNYTETYLHVNTLQCTCKHTETYM